MGFTSTHIRPFGMLLEANQARHDIHKLNMKKLRELFYQNHLLVLRGFDTFNCANELSNYCEQWGEISLWPFGKVLELAAQSNPKDHIFDHHYVPLHWDGMYRQQVPEIQIFHCVNAPSAGGQTTFSNTASAIKQIDPKILKFWSKITGTYERKMEFYHSKTIAPLICKHPRRKFSVIRYCEPPKGTNFINHPSIEFTGLNKTDLKDFQFNLQKSLYARENFYAHIWQKGDIVIADNYTLLHGRSAFPKEDKRHLRRVHILGQPPLTNPHLVSSK